MKDYVLSPTDANTSRAAHMRPRVRVGGVKNTMLTQAANSVVPSSRYAGNTRMDKTEFKARPPVYMSSKFGSAVQMMGKGSNGFTYKVNVGNASTRDTLHSLIDSLANATHGSSLPLSGTVLVKINLPERGSKWDNYVRQSVHESTVHKYLASPATCTKLHCGAVACTAEFVPQFYAAGADTRHGVYVTIMELVRGTTLNKFMKARSQKMSAALFVRIEKAIASMWMAGIAHADFHTANIMITHGEGVKVIDFGMAVMLPADRRAKVQSILRHMPQVGGTLANAAWYARNTMDNYVETVMAKRYHKLPFYNPDGKSLRSLYNKIPAAERAKIKALRHAIWGCGTVETEAERTQQQQSTVNNTQQQQQQQQAFPAHYAPGPPGPSMPSGSVCGLDQEMVAGKCIRIVGSTFKKLPSQLKAEANPMHGLTDLFMGAGGARQQQQQQQHIAPAYLHRPIVFHNPIPRMY